MVVEKKKQPKKKKVPQLDPAEERANKELEKVAAFQARLLKKKNKPKKIRTIIDDQHRNPASMKGKVKLLGNFDSVN